jgi:hypothetical protein
MLYIFKLLPIHNFYVYLMNIISKKSLISSTNVNGWIYIMNMLHATVFVLNVTENRKLNKKIQWSEYYIVLNTWMLTKLALWYDEVS